MELRIREVRGRYYWRLFDNRERLIARGATGYRTYELCRDYARFTWEGLKACLR